MQEEGHNFDGISCATAIHRMANILKNEKSPSAREDYRLLVVRNKDMLQSMVRAHIKERSFDHVGFSNLVWVSCLSSSEFVSLVLILLRFLSFLCSVIVLCAVRYRVP